MGNTNSDPDSCDDNDSGQIRVIIGCIIGYIMVSYHI